MEALLSSSVCTILFLNKIIPNMGSLRQLLKRFFIYPVLATIGFFLTLPFWRIMRDRRVKRDEESDLVGGERNDQCNPNLHDVDKESMDSSEVHDVDKESMDSSEVPSVAEVAESACQSAPKRGANSDENSEEILKRLKIEDIDLTEDELYCEYDSTWETSSSRELKSSSNKFKRFGRPGRTNYRFDRFKNAARDMWNYRHDYPDKSSHRHLHQQPQMPNLEFYVGDLPSAPDGIYIEEFHNEWLGDYYKLEYVHTFIQWLFPLQEPGVNYHAKELTKEEIQAFRKNAPAKHNLMKSYKLMLDFYGISLANEETGEVQRASNWEERFDHLNRHTHNNLRISRILKCLGTLGYRHYQAPLVRFFLQETLVHGNLPNIKESLLNYYMFAVLDKTERQGLVEFAYLNHDPQEDFIWCPKMIQMRWQQQVRPPYLNEPNEMKNQDDKASGTTYNAQDFWSSTSKPSADASPSMKEDQQPLECEDEVGDEASEDLMQTPYDSSHHNLGGPSLDPENLTNSNTSPGITGKPDSEFESQGDKANANASAPNGTVPKSDHESTTEQTIEGGHQVPPPKIHPSSTATDSNKQNTSAHSLREEAVFGQGCSLPGEDTGRNEKLTEMSSTSSTKKKSCSTFGGNMSDLSPQDPDHQMSENTDLDVQKDLGLVSPSPVTGDDQTTETGPNRDEVQVGIPKSPMNPNEESSSGKNAEDGPRNEEGDGVSDDDL